MEPTLLLSPAASARRWDGPLAPAPPHHPTPPRATRSQIATAAALAAVRAKTVRREPVRV